MEHTLSPAAKLYRIFRNYTQSYLASKIGVPKTYYTRYENGILPLSMDKVEKLAVILEVSPNQLIQCSNETKILQPYAASADTDNSIDQVAHIHQYIVEKSHMASKYKNPLTDKLEARIKELEKENNLLRKLNSSRTRKSKKA